MDISAPSWKNPMPTIKKQAPVKNNAIVPTSIGSKNILSSNTTAVIGRTVDKDS